MSLIEYLERDNWQSVLTRNFELALECLAQDQYRFELALECLAQDQYRFGSSALDDIRAWLGLGGMNRVRMHLNKQMDTRRFSPEQKAAINDALETLAQKHRHTLLSLMANGKIKFTQEDILEICGMSKLQFQAVVNSLRAGEHALEEWMQEQRRSETELEIVYQLIDRWLVNAINRV